MNKLEARLDKIAHAGISDEEIYTAGNIEPLCQFYWSPLVAYLTNRVGDEAEHVAREAFRWVATRRDQFDPALKFRPWLYAVATNIADCHNQPNFSPSCELYSPTGRRIYQQISNRGL